MRDYELVLLVSPQVADEDVSGVMEKVTDYVSGHGGEVGTVNPWGRRRLAYHIADFEEATYIQANFKLEPQHTKELVVSLELSEDVIRHLLVKVEQ
ncbi:MAG: 30S ribosomal protein S6 [Dehalococcoidia bacterium]